MRGSAVALAGVRGFDSSTPKRRDPLMRLIMRQGDVLLVKTTRRLSANATPIARRRGRLVLAEGEATGHAHAIDETMAELFEERGGQLYLQASARVALRHEEHGTIEIPPGTYRVIHQHEYSPEAVRRVAD